jgi:hypothetical protein
MDGHTHYWQINFQGWQKLVKNVLMAITLIIQVMHLGQQCLVILRHNHSHASQAGLLLKQSYTFDCQLAITLGSQVSRFKRKSHKRPRSAKEKV